MRIKNIVTGEIFGAEWRTDHPASSFGQPVLVLAETGEAVDAVWYELTEDKLRRYKVQGRDRFGNWDESVIGAEPQTFETREEAEDAIADLRMLGPDWEDAEYRVVEAERGGR